MLAAGTSGASDDAVDLMLSVPWPFGDVAASSGMMKEEPLGLLRVDAAYGYSGGALFTFDSIVE